MIQFDKNICGDLDAASRREWLVTNGTGGYASSTITGLNSRRYHGLLVAAVRPPVGRQVLLSKYEETLILNGTRHALSTNSYPGIIHPDGYRRLIGFRLSPFPVLTYMIDGLEIEQSIFMVHGENTTVVQYEVRRLTGDAARRLLSSESRIEIEIRPLLAMRDFHALAHEDGAVDRRVVFQPGMASMQPYRDRPSLHIAHNAVAVEQTGDWFRNVEYDAERERGFDYREDLFNPCLLRFDLSASSTATLIASTEPVDVRQATEYRQAELDRRNKVAAAAPRSSELVEDLADAADQFIVSRGNGKTIIAGYHWFSDWGRDTMISLPGLTLATGRWDVARTILLEFSRHVDRGMIPNRFPDAGEEPEFNTVDATLWLFEGVRSYLHHTGDIDFVGNTMYPVLAEIIDWHQRGTRYGIHVDDDGLLAAGVPGMQLTWMDAKIGDHVVTPRHGKPVEVQALWYNALCIMEDLARRFDALSVSHRYGSMATAARDSFNRLFWNDAEGALYDVIDGDRRDPSIRPNQIFAVSLPYSMLSATEAEQVVSVVEKELLTPYGLRTLSPRDPRYIGRYEGDPGTRDGAYHQGTVWAWLMGPFITAWVKVHGGSMESRRQGGIWLEAFEDHLSEAGLGQVSEIFDGDFPHEPRGCIAQAWSVAELLRAAIEDVAPRRAARDASVTSRARVAGLSRR